MKSIVLKVLVLVGLVLMVEGCARQAQVWTVEAAPETLGSIKTYAWLEGSVTPGNNVRVNNPNTQAAVRQAIDHELRRLGFTQVDHASADCLVNWLGAIEERVKTDSINHFYSSYGYGAVASALPEGDNKTTQVSYEEGSIIIDLLSPKDGQLLWRGRGADRLLTGLNETEAKLYIQSLVKQILERLPR